MHDKARIPAEIRRMLAGQFIAGLTDNGHPPEAANVLAQVALDFSEETVSNLFDRAITLKEAGYGDLQCAQLIQLAIAVMAMHIEVVRDELSEELMSKGITLMAGPIGGDGSSDGSLQ